MQNIDSAFSLADDGLRRIFSEPWTWNWITTSYTLPPIENETLPFVWYAGQDYITGPGPISDWDYTMTGRRLKLNERWYRVIDIGVRQADRVYLDTCLDEDGECETDTLYLVRSDVCVRTTKIDLVRSDVVAKIPRLSPQWWNSDFRCTDLEQISEGAYPFYYMDQLDSIINPPVFEPLVTAGGAGTFELGKYRYGYTRVDLESGHESAMGPVVEFDATTTDFPEIVYDNPDLPDQAEPGTSYAMRLYRSDRNPKRDECPMYLIQERSPIGTSPFSDEVVGKAIRSRPRYWNGPQTRLDLVPYPDDTTRRLSVHHVHDFGFPLSDTDDVRLGSRSEVRELLKLYMDIENSRSARDAGTSQAGQALFNRHINFLLTRDRQPGNDDAGPENYQRIVPGYQEEDDWTRHLRSRDPR